MPSDKGTKYDKQLVTTGLLLAQKKHFVCRRVTRNPEDPAESWMKLPRIPHG